MLLALHHRPTTNRAQFSGHYTSASMTITLHTQYNGAYRQVSPRPVHLRHVEADNRPCEADREGEKMEIILSSLQESRSAWCSWNRTTCFRGGG